MSDGGILGVLDLGEGLPYGPHDARRGGRVSVIHKWYIQK
jgi:hypothetical protein